MNPSRTDCTETDAYIAVDQKSVWMAAKMATIYYYTRRKEKKSNFSNSRPPNMPPRSSPLKDSTIAALPEVGTPVRLALWWG